MVKSPDTSSREIAGLGVGLISRVTLAAAVLAVGVAPRT
jgi:hypothetical protein